MADSFFTKVNELIDQSAPFAMAIVVRAEKPTSGKPGDKAVVTADGTLYGWVGGACSQPTVIREAQIALKEGKSRFVRLSPDPTRLPPREGLIDLPLTCFSGGTLEIYIEPHYPQLRLLVVGNLPVAKAMVSLGRVMKYDVVIVDPDGDPSLQSLALLRDIGRHVHPDTYAVVATHGNFDEPALEQLLKARPRYVGLVASRKRFLSVLEYLRMQGIPEVELQRVKAPAGLDIQAQNGDEIAVSILAEIIQLRRNTGGPTWEMPVAEASDMRETLLVTESFVASYSGANEEANARPVGSGIAIDPVCLMEVDISTAKYTWDYASKTYYFCAPGCMLSFRRNPEEYLHPKVALDPVCGMEVVTATAQYTSSYRDRTFYFCGGGCKTEFNQQPENFVTIMSHSS